METLHPAVVHFAIVLPLVALTFQGLYLLKKNDAYSKAALVTIVFAAIFVLAAFLTGRDDARGGLMEILQTYDEKGAHELKEHAELGIYLAYSIGVVALLKIINIFKVKNKIVDIILLVSFLLISIVMLNQGKEGGEIVYTHGLVFEAHEMKDTLHESLEDIKSAENKDEIIEILTDATKSALKID